MKAFFRVTFTVLVFFSVFFGQGVAAKETITLEQLTVMALGPLDGRAVVKLPNGKMKVLKIGETIPGTQATVQQVLSDKLVVEEIIKKKGSPPVKQTVWIHKASKPGAPSRVQRLDRQRSAKTMRVQPMGVKRKK